MKEKVLLILLLSFLTSAGFSYPLYSPTWGFGLDLPEEYYYMEGDGRDRFSFVGPEGAFFDIVVYDGIYRNMNELVNDVNIRLGNRGDVDFFMYRGRQTALIELSFGNFSGWALCVELAGEQNPPPMLLALAHGPAGSVDLGILHISALDSIVPQAADRRYPGPITEYVYPRGELIQVPIAMPGLRAMFRERDAEAAQYLIEREFAVLQRHLYLDDWQEAWIRYYRAIYRDSWDRIADAMFQLERYWNVSFTDSQPGAAGADADRILAEKALSWVQGFTYERMLTDSDFINLVSAVTQGRGDCDTRAMLWAIFLNQANIPAAIMVSRNHSHAMGLADIAGSGARFEAERISWLVAETTAPVGIGLIAQDVSDIESWLGVIFEY